MDSESEALIESLRDDIKEMSLYIQAHPEFVASLKTLKVSYDRDTKVLIAKRFGYPDIALIIEINEAASKAFGEEAYVRLLAVTAAFEFDRATEERRKLDARINAPYPKSLQ